MDEQEMDSPSIPDKASRAPWKAAQRVIPVIAHPLAATYDNACTAILWPLVGMLRHVSC